MNDHTDDLFPDGTRRAGGDVVLAGRYKVVRELGRGAMGTVYLAKDTTLGLQVAIKMLPAVLAADPSAMAGLKREALLAHKLTHPHIVTLRHFEHTEAGVFLVMDYVDGKTLAHTLAQGGPLPADHVLRLFRPLAEALDYAHRQGVVHRDIKPSNILLQSDGSPLLTDFGIACEMKESLTRVTGRSSSGTLPYMSPEQFKGDVPAPLHDVYSFAATIYECLAGHPPFHRGQIEWQILNQEPPGISGSLPTPLTKAVLGGLAKDPMGRPRTCCELLARCEEAAVIASERPETIKTQPKQAQLKRDAAVGRAPIKNPCRRGSRLHLVCEAALQGWTVAATTRALEGLARGAGRRLQEYVSDLRSEHRLDIRINGARLTFTGRLDGPRVVEREALAASSPRRRPARAWALACLVLLGVAVGAWMLFGGAGFAKEGSGESSGTPPIAGGDGREDTPSPKPPAVPTMSATATLDSPLEGAWVKTRSVLVRGQVKGDGSQLLLNGEPLAAAGGAFVGQVVAERDGDLRIEVSNSSGQRLTERTVHVDTTRPVIEITSPTGELTTVDQPYARIEGRVVEANLATLTANGTRITPEASGHFMWPVTLEAGRPLKIKFQAVDKAGNESQEVTRTLTYEKPAEAFDATLSAAEAAARKGNWREASRLLDAATSQGLPKGRASLALAQGVEGWRAPPTLEIASPRDGAEIQGLVVRLAGRLETGRKDDRLVVDGNAVPLETGGRFSVNLPYTKAGTYRIGIEVLDDKGARRGGETRTVTLLPPALKTPSWVKVSVEQKKEAARLSVPVAFENDLGMRFVLIPAGEFWMGSPDAEEHRGKDEMRHKVRLTEAYYVQTTEVTNGQYRRKEGSHKSRFTGPQQPVDSVSWNDATSYATWLSSRDAERTYELPTEAEWECACRAGTTTPFPFGDTISTDQANYDGDSTYGRGRRGVDRKKTINVGTLVPNSWGLYDMHGNVLEWCRDRYGAYPSSPLAIDPTGPSSGERRVARGGSWRSIPWFVRSADRVRSTFFYYVLGFRLVVRPRP